MNSRDAWNTGAEAFIEFIDSGADVYRHRVHGPGLLEVCQPLRGLTVLDLGCGHGYFSRLLAREGAYVTAVDLSDALIARAVAAEAEKPLAIDFHRFDAADVGQRLQGRRFDLITGCMSLQDMPEPAIVLRAASDLLAPGGRVVFSIPHPCTDTRVRSWERDAQGNKGRLCLDGYFESGPGVNQWSMSRLKYAWTTPFRRATLTEWSAWIRSAGLLIAGLHEPHPDATLIAQDPELADSAKMPYFLIFELIPARR